MYDCPQGERTTIIKDSPWLEYLSREEVDAKLSPRVFKTHLRWRWIPKADGVKYIYCYRNPLDVVVSYYHHMKTFSGVYKFQGDLDQFVREVFVAENASENGSFFDHVAEYLEQKNNPNIYFITYEDISEDFEKAVRGIARFLGVEISSEKMETMARKCSFESVKRNCNVNYTWLDGKAKDPAASFVRKGKVGDWINHLSEEHVKKIKELVKEKLLPLGANIYQI